jgi:uncharacterized membrane protein YjjP (DUF1212 family)
MDMSGGIRNGIQILHSRWNYEKAKFWFWPIVFGFTILCGMVNGIQGAFFGFMYGIIAGLFLIHEGLANNKKKYP